MTTALTVSVATALVLSAAIFGFFFAWVCSTMWGLDNVDPRIAITAMNAMNESVRNVVFAPAFFGTPMALLVSAGLAGASGNRGGALWFALAALIYMAGAFLPTVMVNVPLNRELLAAGSPENLEEARAVWSAYSAKWQIYNILRTVMAGMVFGAAVIGLVQLVKD